ncbi:MAG: ATP-dependent DNA helicase RecG [Alphaproteobacteria bacterium]|nr:ATP-dependent DNA helicase RecG [Alphaproteobacteria bacterium]
MTMQSLEYLFQPVTRIKGVGAASARTLSQLLPMQIQRRGDGVPIIRDLLFHLPTGLVDRRMVATLEKAPLGQLATYMLTVESYLPPSSRRFGRQPFKVICRDGTTDIILVFFHAREEWIKRMLPIGSRRAVSGVAEQFDFSLQMTHPDLIVPPDKLSEVLRVEPVYPLTAGLHGRQLEKLIQQALHALPEIPEWQPQPPALSFTEALRKAHLPQGEDDLLATSPARQRLIYDEILAQQYDLSTKRYRMKQQPSSMVVAGDAWIKQLEQSLPFSLTDDQQQALAEIRRDMASGRRMLRLLQGDVGSGKTLVALAAMLAVAAQGMQAALMVPSEILARQHECTIRNYLQEAGIATEVALLTGSVHGQKRTQIFEALAEGTLKLVVGTQALIQSQVSFASLALIVIDEQHRFGVNQRMALRFKAHAPHVLQMSATPIPRSLAMTLYGDMECSFLRTKPLGRKPVVTRVLPQSRSKEVVDRLAAALARGQKAYWICPWVEQAPQDDAAPAPAAVASSQADHDTATATTRFHEFKARFHDKVGLVHGRMPSQKREEVMQRFQSGEIQLLVATTVVEVGVDVPDATIMVIEQAQRFGLSTLHQLRGRVGRSSYESSCVLLYDEKPSLASSAGMVDSAMARLSILRDSNDGFIIADADLRQRGGGEIIGTRQSGQQPYVFASFPPDPDLVIKARDHAEARVTASSGNLSETSETLLMRLFLP